jgi:hypothetical protein
MNRYEAVSYPIIIWKLFLEKRTMRFMKTSTLKALFLLFLVASIGCASYLNKMNEGEPPLSETVTTSDLLLGRIEQPALARAALQAWRMAYLNKDAVWMEGLEKRFSYPIARMGMTFALQEDTEHERWPVAPAPRDRAQPVSEGPVSGGHSSAQRYQAAQQGAEQAGPSFTNRMLSPVRAPGRGARRMVRPGRSSPE